MGDRTGTETRKRTRLIAVRATPEEVAAIQSRARDCSMAPSTLMRELALNHRPASTVDRQAIARLARLQGDLGRLGGLLKMWLSNDERLALGESLDVPGIVRGIDGLRAEVEKAVEALVEKRVEKRAAD